MAIDPASVERPEGIRTLFHRRLTRSAVGEDGRAAVVACPSRPPADAFNGLETAVLADLKPPLNLDTMPRSPIRERLAELIQQYGRGAPSR